MKQEPEWTQCGYAVNGYEAQCRICDTTISLDFGETGKTPLTVRELDNVDQDELFAFVFFWSLEKLRRECDCSEDERSSYERGDTFGTTTFM